VCVRGSVYTYVCMLHAVFGRRSNRYSLANLTGFASNGTGGRLLSWACCRSSAFNRCLICSFDLLFLPYCFFCALRVSIFLRSCRCISTNRSIRLSLTQTHAPSGARTFSAVRKRKHTKVEEEKEEGGCQFLVCQTVLEREVDALETTVNNGIGRGKRGVGVRGAGRRGKGGEVREVGNVPRLPVRPRPFDFNSFGFFPTTTSPRGKKEQEEKKDVWLQFAHQKPQQQQQQQQQQ